MSPKLPLLHNISLPEIIYNLETGSLTSKQLVKTYLARISEVNHEFHAIIETNPNALTIAKQLDTETKTSSRRGLLHGVPVLLKDNIPTLNGTETTCGSLALVGAKPPCEAVIVTALRRAGAVVLGKGNMAEWSGFRSTSGCSGWSPRGGQATGIFYPGMKASGSSSGCAIATALGLCFAAIGTETIWSIASPAEKCGIVGFKPTRGLIPTDGIIYNSLWQDSIGLLTRNVADAMHVFSELLHRTWNTTPAIKRRVLRGIRNANANLSLNGIRIGVPRNLRETRDIARVKADLFTEGLALLQGAGAEVRDVEITGASEYESLSPEESQIILDTDMKIATNDYLSSLTTNPNNIRDLRDLIDFIKACPEEEYPKRNVEGLERAQQTTGTDNILYKKMLERDDYFVGEGGIEGALKRHNCDVLIIPALSTTMQSFASKLGSPVMTVPVGWFPHNTTVETDPKNGLVTVAPGIPFSIYVFGRAGQDKDVLKVGYIFEQLTRVRERLQPYLMPTIELSDDEETQCLNTACGIV